MEKLFAAERLFPSQCMREWPGRSIALPSRDGRSLAEILSGKYRGILLWLRYTIPKKLFLSA